MSGETNLELVEALLPSGIDMVEFVRSGGSLPPEALARVSPELEIEFLPEALGSQITGTGLTGLLQGWAEWLEPYESYVITIESYEALSESEILLLVKVQARTRRDGVTVEHSPAAVATIRDGLLVRMRFYLERDEARAGADAG